ncbi:MAG TPA: flagellin [Stellaceae bacterium]|nr:flagellin [Stellaceae bacterium]
MTRITTAAQDNLLIGFMQQNQAQLDKLTTEVSTNSTGQTYADIAPQAGNLVDLKAQVASQQSFNTTINTVSTRLQLMNLSVSDIQKQIQAFRGLIPNGAFNNTQPTIQTQAKTLLQQIAGSLNTTDGTRYLFAGTSTNTPPVTTASLPTAPLSLVTPVNGPPSAGGYYQGGGPVPPAQIDTQLSLNYAISAQDPGTFEPIMRVLNFIANSPPFNSSNPVDNANLQTAANLLDGADANLTTMLGNIGLQEQQLNQAQTLHTNTIAVAQSGISNIQNIDQASVITQLNNLDTEIQASYAATSQIGKLSLVNFL